MAQNDARTLGYLLNENIHPTACGAYPLSFQSQNQKARPLNSPHCSNRFSTSLAVMGSPRYHSFETIFRAYESIGMKSCRPSSINKFAAAYGPTPLIVNN